MMSIQNNLQKIQAHVKEAAEKSGRDPQDIQIILAVKTVSPERILKAAELGYTTVAENRVQEAEQKIEKINSKPKLDWHFIGHVQSNKVNKIVRFATMVQSIDRMKIVKKMNRRLKKVDKQMDILIQINTSGEDSKYGVHPGRAIDFVQKASKYERLHIKGLMTIGLFSRDWPKVRQGFRQLREIRDAIAAKDIAGVKMEHLSMGMTNDFKIAVEEGATMVRIGRAIFGERKYPDSYYWPRIKPQK
ncbi:MAG TPA: YggS family pyridoxal phosphate-dependent enzyme [Balneolaceae bacterium]|nr:YggS family pyridoxal phosphate-dependent enzyme [Balneolaceae bacterium]